MAKAGTVGPVPVKVAPWRRVAFRRYLRRSFPFYLFLLPTFVFLAVFNYYPIVSAFYYSVFQADFGSTPVFIGLKNFTDAVQDPVLLGSVPNVVYWIIFQVAVQLTVPLITAEIIFHMRHERVRHFWRVLFVVPLVVPPIVIWLIWQFIYSDQGVVNNLLTWAGHGELTRGWLNDPQFALPSIFFIGFPFVYPIALLIYYAGLLNISRDVHEAAQLDGITAISRFFKIDVPLIVGQIRLIALLVIITVVTQGYQTVLVLTGGGPGNVTMMPGLYLYNNAFQYQKLGYASAIGVLVFVVILGLTVLITRLLRSSVEYQP